MVDDVMIMLMVKESDDDGDKGKVDETVIMEMKIKE